MDPITLAYILIAFGIVLLVAEMFVFTGGIIAGAGACLALVGVALLFAYGPTQTALASLLGLCLGGPALAGLMFYLWPYSRMSRKLIKAAEEDVTVASMAGNSALEGLKGRTGKAVSPLRPSGIAEFDGRRIDVITEGMMVEAGRWVKCIEVRAGKVLVRPTAEPASGGLEAADFS